MLNVVHTESLEEHTIRVVLVRKNAQIVIAVFQTGQINVIATFRSNIATGLVKQIK
ncbi:putative potassium transport system protein kup [Yersinia pestis PY-89]|nr:putative potassium transport system protein kup [Yersinia pestis PY-89]